MYEFKHILIGLDSNGEMDHALFSYLKLLESSFPVHTIDVLHINNKYRKLSETDIKDKLTEFGLYESKLNINIIIKEGRTAKNILKHAKSEAVDLIVTGRKMHNGKTKRIAKVINEAECSVLLIPENPFTAIRKIVVGVDYSDQIIIGIQKAMDIARTLQAEVIFAHVYHVPAGYHISGKSYKEYSEIMEKNARKDADTFLKKHSLEKLNFRSVFILDDNNEPSDRIFRFAVDENADLLCISSTGLKAVADIFFSSTAEMLFKIDNSIPLLVAKEHKANKGFLAAIRDL